MDYMQRNKEELIDDLISLKQEYKSLRKLFQGEIARREHVEEGLRLNEAKFEIFTHKTSELIFVLDKSGRCVFFNGSLETVLGYTAEEAVGKPFSNFVPIQEIPRYLLYLKKTFQNKEIIDFTTRIVHKDGHLVDVEINGKLTRNDGQLAVEGIIRDISARIRVQDALNESLKSYKGLFDSVSEAIYIHKEDGVFMDVNAGATSMYGYSRDEMIGRTPELLSAPGMNDLKKVRALTEKTMRTGKPEQFEFWGIRKNGEVFPKDVICHKGKYFGEDVIIVTARDITEHKQADEKLNLYKKIIDNSTDGVAILDKEFNFLDINAAYGVLTGYNSVDLAGKNIAMHLGLDCFEMVKQSLSGQCSYHSEMLTMARGEDIFIDLTAFSIKRDCGDVLCHVVIERDITKRKKAEHALRESESKYRILAEKMHDVVWILDLDLKLAYVSPSTEFTLGYSPEERMTMRIDECMVPESLDYAMQTLINEAVSSQEDMANKNRGVLLELEYYHKDGTTRWLEQSINGIYDENGDLTGIMGVAREVTERKKAKDALQQSEESYRGLFNSVNDAIYVLDQNGKFIDVNKGAETMYGYPREVLVGKDPAFVSAPGKNDLESVAEMLGLAYEGKPQQFDFWGKRSNGEVFLKDVRLYNGVYYGQKVIIALSQDITNRKQNEVALKTKVEELEFMNRRMIVEEHQLVSLKKEVNELLLKLGEKQKYTIH
jgi:PAS domain S-box-containing protein